MQKAKRNNAEVVIRELRLEDYDALTGLWREGGLPYRPNGRDAPEAIARQLQERTAVYLVAEVAGAFVGAVLATHDGRKGWINRLAVLRAYRRRRVGAQLLAEAERRLATLAVEIFACLVEDWNGESKGFFEKSGYKPFRDVSYYTKRKYGDV